MILFHSAKCSLFPTEVVDMLTSAEHANDYKRQSNSQLQCVNNLLNDHFQGNTSQFVADCKSIATDETELDFSNTASVQVHISRIYKTFCVPECGNVVNDAYRRCQVYSNLPPGTEDLNVALCGKKETGISCYLLYGRGLDLITTESQCYNTYASTDVCTCRSQISAGVAEQGCCLDAYHDFIEGLSNTYNPNSLYSACNVDVPRGCNNSPLSTAATTQPTTPNRPTTQATTQATTPNRPTASADSSASEPVLAAITTILIVVSISGVLA